MTLRWYNVPAYRGKSIDEVAELLAPMGIQIVHQRVGQVHWFYDDEAGPMKSIGDIILRKSSGRLEVWPYRGATNADIRVLLGSAEDAFRNTPTRRENWLFERRADGRSYWRTSVNVPAHPTAHPGAEKTMFWIIMASRLPLDVDRQTEREARARGEIG